MNAKLKLVEVHGQKLTVTSLVVAKAKRSNPIGFDPLP